MLWLSCRDFSSGLRLNCRRFISRPLQSQVWLSSYSVWWALWSSWGLRSVFWFSWWVSNTDCLHIFFSDLLIKIWGGFVLFCLIVRHYMFPVENMQCKEENKTPAIPYFLHPEIITVASLWISFMFVCVICIGNIWSSLDYIVYMCVCMYRDVTSIFQHHDSPLS